MCDREHTNPFCLKPVQEPKQFFGRRQMTRDVLYLLEKGQVVYFDGPAKIGKTSFLAFVAHPSTRRSHKLSENRTFVYLDNRVLAVPDPGRYYLSVIDEIIRQVQAPSALDATCSQELERAVADVDPASPFLGLMNLCQVVQDCGLGLILVLDDGELLAAQYGDNPRFFSSLRSLTMNFGVGYLIASQVPLHDLEQTLPEASPFYNTGHWMSLGPLTEDESSELVVALLDQAGVELGQFAQDYILELGENNPYRLKLAGRITLEVWQERGGHLERADQTTIGKRFRDECQSP